MFFHFSLCVVLYSFLQSKNVIQEPPCPKGQVKMKKHTQNASTSLCIQFLLRKNEYRTTKRRTIHKIEKKNISVLQI
jgi:hypothetical protein